MISKVLLMTLNYFLMTLNHFLMTLKHFLMTLKHFLVTLGRAGHSHHDLFKTLKSGFGCHAFSQSQRPRIASPAVSVQVLVIKPATLLRVLTHLGKLFILTPEHGGDRDLQLVELRRHLFHAP